MSASNPHVAPPVVLTVAGFDPSSGAGVTADLKTIAAHGCYGVSVITALTVQNTQGVYAVQPVEPAIVVESLRRLAEDFPIAAVKVGMLGNGDIAQAVAEGLDALQIPNVVVDPIMWSSSGAELLDEEGREVVREVLMPLATIVTPNALEAMALTGDDIRGLDTMEAPAAKILAFGARAVVITGGDLERPDDLLVRGRADGTVRSVRLPGERVETHATHGTGCAFSTSIACLLARGVALEQAVREAKRYVERAMELAPRLGHGKGPLEHLWTLE